MRTNGERESVVVTEDGSSPSSQSVSLALLLTARLGSPVSVLRPSTTKPSQTTRYPTPTLNSSYPCTVNPQSIRIPISTSPHDCVHHASCEQARPAALNRLNLGQTPRGLLKSLWQLAPGRKLALSGLDRPQLPRAAAADCPVRCLR